MAATDHHPTPAQLHHADVVARSFRRVVWQRIELEPGGGGRGVVTGLRHRLPSTVEVSLDTALELRRRGVRTVVHRVA